MAALGAVLLIAGVGYGLAKQVTYEQEAQQKSADYATHAADQIEQACLNPIPLEKARCIYDAVAEYRLKTRDNQREYADLVAQQKSALWTSIMGIAALIGMGLSAIGVALVYTTFQQTRRQVYAALKSNEIAEDTAKRQLRAYVMAESIQVSDFYERGKPWFSVTYHNRGQSPAHDVKCVSLVQVAEVGDATFKFLFRRGKPRTDGSLSIIGPGQTHGQIFRTRDEFSPQAWREIVDGRWNLYFAGVVSYKDIFGRRRFTTFKYALRDVNERDSGYNLTACGKGNKAN